MGLFQSDIYKKLSSTQSHLLLLIQSCRWRNEHSVKSYSESKVEKKDVQVICNECACKLSSQRFREGLIVGAAKTEERWSHERSGTWKYRAYLLFLAAPPAEFSLSAQQTASYAGYNWRKIEPRAFMFVGDKPLH